MVAIADSQGDAIDDLFLQYNRNSPSPPGTIHRGGANVLVADGHVQWYLQDQITTPPNPSLEVQQLESYREVVKVFSSDNEPEH